MNIKFTSKDGRGFCIFGELSTGDVTIYVEDHNGHHAKITLPCNGGVLGLISQLEAAHEELCCGKRPEIPEFKGELDLFPLGYKN